ncbi:flavin reductase family protein [Streptomyces sp. KL118A]|uniref:flavin reductase family protein n=1 Tax=Streptomyces sp. KL118A TaxID=3045153 RepID=UPI00278C4613|nr:flavin reductase family protein [Streptomyces sp. KL118A]
MTATPTDTHRQQAGPIDAKTLRTVCGLFVTGVTVITSGSGPRAAGTTVNSFTSVSLDPPLVLFCLHQASRLRPLVEESGAYTVNFLAGRQEPLAWAFAGKHTATLQDVEHRYSGVGVPVLSQAMAFVSCRLVNAFEGGDHTIFVGEVAELGVARADTEPLIFFRGSMGALEDEPRGPHPMFDS